MTVCTLFGVVHFVYPVWWCTVLTPFGGPLCLPRLVVHCVYPVWWKIILNQLARRSPGAASRTRLRLNSGWNADAFKPVCDLKAVAKHICDPTAVGTQTLNRTVRRKLCDGNCATETVRRKHCFYVCFKALLSCDGNCDGNFRCDGKCDGNFVF